MCFFGDFHVINFNQTSHKIIKFAKNYLIFVLQMHPAFSASKPSKCYEKTTGPRSYGRGESSKSSRWQGKRRKKRQLQISEATECTCEKKRRQLPIGWWQVPWFALAVGQNQWVCGDACSEAFSIIAACLNLLIQLHFSLWSKKYWNQIAEAKAIIFGTVITVAVGYGQSCGLSNFSIYPPGVCVLSLFPFSTMGRVCRRDSSAAAWLKMMCFSASRCETNGASNTPEVIHAMSNDSNLFELSMYKNTNWTRYPISIRTS